MGKSLYQKKQPGVYDMYLVDFEDITVCSVEDTILTGLITVKSGQVRQLAWKKVNPELEPLD